MNPAPREPLPNSRADARMYVVIRYTSYVGIVAHSLFIPLFALLGVRTLAIFNVFSVVLWLFARAANERRHSRLAFTLLVSEVAAHAVLAVWLLGWSSGFHYYLIGLLPFMMFQERLSTRAVVVASVSLMAVYMVLYALTSGSPPVAVRPDLLGAMHYLNMFVPLAAIAVMCLNYRYASADIEHEMEQLAMTDALTLLPNRRQMHKLLQLAGARAAGGGEPFSVIIADIDGFKRINDTLGHDGGDHVLREGAAVLRAAIREQDVVARWGGEEFLVLLPRTDTACAGVVAEKLRSAVERATLVYSGQAVPLTMTFGVADFSGTGSIEACISDADQSLYNGKKLGKNRVVLAAGV